jgi:hypothetical protein
MHVIRVPQNLVCKCAAELLTVTPTCWCFPHHTTQEPPGVWEYKCAFEVHMYAVTARCLPEATFITSRSHAAAATSFTRL